MHFENRYQTKSGDWRWLAWTARHSKEDALIFACAGDITPCKQMMTEKQFRYLVDLLSFGKGWDIGIANLRITAELAVRQKLSNDFLIELVNFLPKGNGHGFYYLLTTYTFPALQKTFKIDPSGKWGLKLTPKNSRS